MMLRTPVCSYPIIVTHLSFNFLCLLLLYSIYLNGSEAGVLDEPYSRHSVHRRSVHACLLLGACFLDMLCMRSRLLRSILLNS
jgi:hypothetical protein